jgi:hypothetical protein
LRPHIEPASWFIGRGAFFAICGFAALDKIVLDRGGQSHLRWGKNWVQQPCSGRLYEFAEKILIFRELLAELKSQVSQIVMNRAQLALQPNGGRRSQVATDRGAIDRSAISMGKHTALNNCFCAVSG